MFKRWLSGFIAIALLFVTHDASAFSYPKPYFRCVGDHAIGAAAADATIQDTLGRDAGKRLTPVWSGWLSLR